MRRKILLLCLLICSIMGLWACGSSPYENLSLTVYCNDKVLEEDAVINLNIKQEAAGVYNYEQVVLLVKVDDDNDETDRGITVSDGQGFVSTTTQYDPNSGMTSIVVKANSAANTGTFSLKISTNEGNKSRLVKFNIDLALENFDFKEDALQVVGKGQSLSLKNVDDYIEFYPAETTQRDIKVELATLSAAGDGVTHFVDGWMDGGNFSYLNDGRQYASIINGVLTTYDSYDNGSGVMTKIAYPTQTVSASMGSQSIQQEVVVVKASFYLESQKEYLERFIAIPVIESCAEIEVNMNAQAGDAGEFILPLAEGGYYEIVLIDPSFRDSIFTSNLEYYIERELNFYLSENFHVEADPTTDDMPVDLVPITGENHYKVHAMKAGIYKHEFRIVHDDYPDLFDQRVIVEFTVKDLPTDVLINGSDKMATFEIYDYYENSKGERIDVDLNTKVGKYEYCIYARDYEGILNVNLNTARSTENLVFANYSVTNRVLTSTVEGKAYTMFGPTDSFYLSHSFTTLPSSIVPLYIGVHISLCGDSYYDNYTHEEINSAFLGLLMSRTFHVGFQMGLREFEFVNDKFHIDLTKNEYSVDGHPKNAVPLCVLPEGQTIDSCISKIEYDKSLINITEYTPSEKNARTVVVAQCNSDRKEGTTAVRFTARNGVTGTISVSTFMPTIYKNHTAEFPVPMAITVDEKSSGYLYRITGNSQDVYGDDAAHFSQHTMVDATGKPLGSYDSLHTLFGIVGKTINLSFYDYTYIASIFEKYNVTHKVKVSFNNDGYVTYENGVLSLHRLVVDVDMPIIMTVKYTGGYETLDENNQPLYQEVNLEHKVKIYIYNPLQGVNILSEKSASLYVYDSLSYYDRTSKEISNANTRDLSTNIIRATFNPSEGNLGAAWNDEFNTYKPLSFTFNCSMLNEAVKDKNGKAIIVQSNRAGNDYPLHYRDIFKVDPSKETSGVYTCKVQSVLSEELKEWIYSNYGGNATHNYKIQSFLKNYILDRDYSIVVNIYAGQFSRLSNINTITYTSCYASKINSLKLNVDDDGVYFDIRDGKQQSVIEYTIDNAQCINKEMIIVGGVTNHYTTKIEYGSGNTGKIIIDTIDGMLDGALYNLTIIPKDNVSDYTVATGYTFYTESLNQTIRIKIADGTKALPFEIKSAEDFKSMLEDINEANIAPSSDTTTKYYNYVLARDINLFGENLDILNIEADNRETFSLSGKHTYSRNNETISLYNKIYNLSINRSLSTVSDDMYIGLFGRVGIPAAIENLSVLNTRINLETSGEIDSSKNIYVGIVAGALSGATLTSVSVSGSITTNLNAPQLSLYIGGIVGADTSNGGVIRNRPESAIAGMAASSNNTVVEISLNGSVKNQNVGGVAGMLTATNIQTLQVVSQIKSKTTAEKESLGGVVGVYSATQRTITGMQVSPVIVVESRGSAVGNIGSIVGEYTAGTIANSKVYFTNLGDDYSQKEKINIYVSGLIKANLGGLVGLVSGSAAKELKYSYLRSFYNNDIQKGRYAGNIFVLACDEAYVGGIAGFVDNTAAFNLTSSYFDGDIVVEARREIIISAEQTTDEYIYPSATGLMFGSIKAGQITDSYGIGKIYYNLTTTTTDLTVDPAKVTSVNEFIAANTLDYRDGIVGNTEYSSSNETILGKEYKAAEFAATFTNVYAVVNDLAHYFGSAKTVVMVDSLQKLIDDEIVTDTKDLFGNKLGYNMTDGSRNDPYTVLDYNWFYNEKINLAGSSAYPILLSASGLAMYDLVPTGIGIIVNEENRSVFDISYTDETNVRHNQMIMFVKKTPQGVYSNDYYEIMVENSEGSDQATIKVTFNGEDIDTYLVDIAIDDQIEIFLKNNNSVLELVNNRIYPRNEGEATIEIRSYLDKTIKVSITVKVIASVDTIKMYEIVEAERAELQEDLEFRTDEEIRTVYIDESSNFEITACDSEGYISTKAIGYILELLSYETEGGVPNNGAIIIDGKKYEYVEGEPNTYFLEGDGILKASGDSLGYVKFKLTPYLKLDNLYHADTYTCENGDVVEFQDEEKKGINVYVLNKQKLDVSKIFVLGIKARAFSVDNTPKAANISASNGFDLVATVETSNVIDTPIGGGKYHYSILENVYIDMGLSSSKIDYNNLKIIELEGKEEGINLLETDGFYYFGYFDKDDEFHRDPYVFEYELIKLQVNGFSIEKTNVNTETRLNTFKIYIGMHVSFDKEFYRANANKYDLNTVKFNINVIPYTNLLLDIANFDAPYGLKNPKVIDKTVVDITPADLKDIFMNYYTRGEGLLGNTENTYPNDNESNFIVPGREGLLKITLPQEFNNSSYVTITLDRKYAGFVKLEQMAGIIIDSVDSVKEDASEFASYQTLDYVDPVETSEYYGLRLQKLSANSKTASFFNNTYYVKVTLAEASDYSDFISDDPTYNFNPIVEIKATSYTVDKNGSVKETLENPRVKVLTIAELPSVIAQVDGSSVFYMGVGVKKVIDIKYKGLTHDIMIASSTEYLYVVDDKNERVATLEIDYLDAKRKYYLCLSVDAYYDADPKFSTEMQTLTFTAEEYVWGVLETTKSELWVNPVEYEITGVHLQDTNVNKETGETELTINHGQSVILRLDFEYAKIEVGDEENIRSHIALLDTYYKYGDSDEAFSPKQLVEYAIAGTEVKVKENGVETKLSKNILELNKITYSGKEENLEPVYEIGKVYGGIELLNDSYISSYDKDETAPIVEISFTLLRGVSISNDGLLRLSVPYHYDKGMVLAGKSSSGIYYDDYIDFRVIVKDNSSDTHPTPIENATDLKNYADTTGHYILVNNIELTNWEPIPIKVDSLDGNGYSIIIKSFNMSPVRAASDVNAGIFTTVAENTLLKNITIDISHLLTDETTILNNVNIVNNSTADKFVHDPSGSIDLTFISTLNFGILAGTNNGAITNAKVVNTKEFNSKESTNKYLHILTSQIDKEGNAAVSNVGGLVGVNSATGAISNSLLGINISNQSEITLAGGDKELRSYITVVTHPNSTPYHNKDDMMIDVQVHPFVLSSSNNVAGMAAKNLGIISNSYTKGLGVYNTYTAVSNSITAGLVGVNDNTITSCFTEGAYVENYRATGRYLGETDYRDTIEAVGNVGGLVFTNNATIENSYANVYLETQSSFIAGFVFTNNGTISRSYSTSVNRNNLAYGQFTGVLQRVVQNFGTYENCYYLVGAGEAENEKESATPILIEHFTESKTAALSDFWTGFSFTVQSGANEEDGIWTIKEGLPKIATTLTDTNSFRVLDQIEEITDENGILQYQEYSYLYGTSFQEGTKGNPLVIESAKNFDIKIIDRGRQVGDEYIFGAVNSRDILDRISAVEYVRLVNNLDFSSITTSNIINGRYLYQTIFAGKLDGNGMSMNNLHIDTDTTQLSDFGIFKQIGYDATKSSSQTVIKNINMTLSSYKSNNNSKAGVLAGTIKNATITNVTINGNGIAISATNMAGALAGLIVADNQNKVSITDVVVENVIVSAEYSSIGGEIDAFATDESEGRYAIFNVLNRENNVREPKSFKTLGVTTDANGVVSLTNTSSVSYAGAVAGVLIANNHDVKDGLYRQSNDIGEYRSDSTGCSIDNIVVRNNITIKTADNAGGLFGYVSENSRIKNSRFELGTGTQLIKSWNFAGGIVGENHGIIEQCFVAYPEDQQEELDATIAGGVVRDSGTVNLFSMSDGSFYNVAVGGIAGYSGNGAIIDSFSKASVIQPLAFIAGGLVGYAEGANFIGFSYSTGAVYARTVMGGIVGLQVTYNGVDYNDSLGVKVQIIQLDHDAILHLNTVVALNDWDTYRDNISTILYNNYKTLYYSGEGYENFHLKLPEVGNQGIDLTLEYVDGMHRVGSGTDLDAFNINLEAVKDMILTAYNVTDSDMDAGSEPDGVISDTERRDKIVELLKTETLLDATLEVVDDSNPEYIKALKKYYAKEKIVDIPSSYERSHTKMFVGSVVGASYIFGYSTVSNGQYKRCSEFLSSYELENLYDDTTASSDANIHNTFSTTYGMYSIEGNGSLENGNRCDTYYEETYSLPVGVEENVTLYSYRIPYLTSDIEFNNRALNFMDDTNYMDKVSFRKVFTGQEYTEQIIGAFYRVLEGENSYSKTYSIFKGYDADRYSVKPETKVFIEGTTEPVWEMASILPKMNDGTFVPVEYFYAADESKIEAVFKSSSNERTYYLVPGTEDDRLEDEERDKSDPSTSPYTSTTDNVFDIEIKDNNIYIKYMATIRSVFIGETVITKEGKEIRPTIRFNISSKDVASVFNFISGANFSNIDIIIRFISDNSGVISSNSLANAARDYTDYGFLANTIENVTFDNCSITVDYNNGAIPNFTSLGDAAAGVDGVYNAVNNGLLFGSVSNSTIKNTKINILIRHNAVDASSNKIGVVKLNDQHIENFGLVAGSVYRTKLENNEFTIKAYVPDANGNVAKDLPLQISIDKVAQNTNIGAVFGVINNSTYRNNTIASVENDVNEKHAQTIRIVDDYTSIDADENLTKSISSLIGYAYNSTVDLSKVTTNYETMKLKYTNLQNDVVADIISAGAVAGASYNTKYIGIELKDYVLSGVSETDLIEFVSGDIRLEKVSVGAIIGIDRNSSQVGELIDDSIIGNSSSISVVTKANIVAVGGLVGDSDKGTKVYNAYNTADITVTNSRTENKITKKDSEGKDVIIDGEINTYLGGIIGAANGKPTMESILSAGVLSIGKTDVTSHTGFAMGGLIGYMSQSSDLSKFVVLTDFAFAGNFANSPKNTYVSGVVGLNKGTFSAKDGYTNSEFLFDYIKSDSVYSSVLVSAITNNRITVQENVFYAQEFIGNNYLSDSKFMSYSIADLYGMGKELGDSDLTINKYNKDLSAIKLNSLMDNILVKHPNKGTMIESNMALPITDSLKSVRVVVLSKDSAGDIDIGDGFSRFNVKPIASGASAVAYQPVPYSVITESVTMTNIETLPDGYYIAGRTTGIVDPNDGNKLVTKGKVVVSLNYTMGSSEAGYMVGVNNGVISNIYLSTAKVGESGNMQELNVSLVSQNNGLITNVYVYERTTSQYGFALNNAGRIYQSAVATVYLGDELEIFAFAKLNTGYIYDCYSASVGYTENNTKTTDVYMVEDNGYKVNEDDENGIDGTIMNSYYYIPKILDFDNVLKGYYKKKKTVEDREEKDISRPGKVTSCYNNEMPAFVDGRDAIWYEENGHAQLRGIKDIEGAMVIHIYYTEGTTLAGERHDINSVYSFKSQMKTDNYVYSYKIHFYEKEEERKDYTVIRVVNGSDLTEYINSLAKNNYTVPNKTVIAVLNNIEVSPVLLQEFSLSPEAMMVGLYHEVWDWVKEEGKEDPVYKLVKVNTVSTVDFVKGEMEHSLIKCNDGILTNILFRRLSIVFAEQGSAFAPIMQNNGIINGIQLGYSPAADEEADDIGIKIVAPSMNTVSALVNINNGYINNTTLYSLNIQSMNRYAVFIICNNAGLASGKINNLHYYNISTSAKMYTDPKAYNGN